MGHGRIGLPAEWLGQSHTYDSATALRGADALIDRYMKHPDKLSDASPHHISSANAGGAGGSACPFIVPMP